MNQTFSLSLRCLTRRLVHTNASSNEPRIYLSKDEKCFVSYHPTKDHPYECTRPLPVHEVEISHLKVNSKNMIVKGPNLEQLQSLTYTPKSYWRQDFGKQKRDAYKKFFDDKGDRKGLTS